MTRWEYALCVIPRGERALPIFNKWGKEGWILCTVTRGFNEDTRAFTDLAAWRRPLP